MPKGSYKWTEEHRKQHREMATLKGFGERLKHQGKEFRFNKGNKLGKKFQKGVPKLKGKDNPNWKGGLTPEQTRIRNGIEIRLWREAVFARDNWTCQKCRDNEGGNLNAHHICNFADYPGLRTAISNGLTICIDCHRKFHKIYGKINNTQEQLEEFLSCWTSKN